jgi:hypothetical protein
VYKAKCKETGRMVALKRVRMDNEKEGVRPSALSPHPPADPLASARQPTPAGAGAVSDHGDP